MSVAKEQGYECYDWYHYLWHLIAIGAVKRVAGNDAKYDIEPDAWADLGLPDGTLPGDGETIALIDTGVNDKHPNLPRIEDTVNFAVHPYGAKYVPAPAPDPVAAPPGALDDANVDTTMKRGLEDPLDDSLVRVATWDWAMLFADNAQDEILNRLREGRGVTHHVLHTSRERYSGHGTACAGLMVGAPPDPVSVGDDGPIPYWGVAPGASLLPIVVSAQPTAEQLIFALLYARDQGVSVIHFPREAADPARAHKHHAGYGDTRYATDPQNQIAWDLFERILEEVSNEIPVVCAAGNDGYDHLIYPASKADDNNGIISVGAVTYRAKRASFSNYCRAASGCRLTIAAPSDDEEVYTRRQVRLDKEAAGWRDHNFTVHTALNPDLEVVYSPQSLFTTDVPGPRGYADGVLEGLSTEARENQDRAALYALFGGTSGASAIVAGAVALLQAKELADNGARLDGGDVKAKVNNSGLDEVDWPWLTAPPVAVATDTPNGEAAADVSFEHQFGDGVLNLHDLLA